ncbi:tetratricopeptide repeat protein [Nonlabens antarcticus]|uniref:tetratricopeptide repeat protein n=1 Tax=Nonlabens antarcticus TaxID=392714 RepID=UPI001891DB73|nr:tetratricopeptide repeat protein [Nonlabens antarcticus]
MFNNLMVISFFLVAIVSVSAQERVGDSLMEIGDYSNAIVAYKASELTPNLQFKLAKAYTVTGNTTKAMTAYQIGLKEDSTAVKPRFDLARLHLSTNDPINSFSLFNQLVEEFPENATYQFYKGQILELLKSDEKAMEIYGNVLKLNPDYRSARMELVALLIKKRKTFPAIKYSQEVLNENPDDIKFNSLIAQAFYSAKIYSKAIEHLEHLFEINNDTEFNRKTLGLAYFEDAQWQKAIENFDIFLKQYQERDADIYFMKSRAHLRLKEYDKALDAIEYCILFRRPAIDQEYLQLASIKAAQEDYKGTFDAMKLAYEENAEDAVIAYQFAVAADRYFKDKKAIIGYYERYLNKFGESSSYGELVTFRISDLKKELFMSESN